MTYIIFLNLYVFISNVYLRDKKKEKKWKMVFTNSEFGMN